MELTQQLPDPEWQKTCPEEEHNGEDQVQHLQEIRPKRETMNDTEIQFNETPDRDPLM